MASTSIQQISLSSSSAHPSFPPQYYEAFLSFRGEDTRKTFVSYLYTALCRRAIITFIDDKLKRGVKIGPQLEETIEKSRAAIVVFSRNYAGSRSCLNELLKIVECKKKAKQLVIPVFYNISPSDVRKQKGSFAKAFARHRKHCEPSELKRWRDALRAVGELSGLTLESTAGRCKAKLIEKIVKYLLRNRNFPLLDVPEHPIGLKSRVEHVEKMLRLESHDVGMIGILGVGGLGKTTIAKAVFNHIRCKFEGISFLSEVGKNAKHPGGMVELQKTLISDVLHWRDSEIQNIRNDDRGIMVIKKRLSDIKVLIVLDGVDNSDQLEKLVGKRHDWLHAGSRIIVTTRDKSLLNFLKENERYEPELLTENESLQLFSLHAFGKDHPIEDKLELSSKVVDYAQGLPLVLKDLGSFLLDKSITEWKDKLAELKVIPLEKVIEKLKTS